LEKNFSDFLVNKFDGDFLQKKEIQLGLARLGLVLSDFSKIPTQNNS